MQLKAQKFLSFIVPALCSLLLSLTQSESRAEEAVPQSESRLAHRRSQPLLIFSFDYRRNGDEELAISHMKFGAQMAIFAKRGHSFSFEGGVPVRSVESHRAGIPTASELGGFEVYGKYRFLHNYEIRAGIGQRLSPKIALYEDHLEYLASFRYELREALVGNIGLMLKGGPDVAYALDTLQAGAQAELFMDLFFSKAAHFRLGTEFLFRRAGTDQLATFTPSINYHLLDELWVGLFTEIPTSRPVGREGQFGNSELAGLYGRSIGLALQASAF